MKRMILGTVLSFATLASVLAGGGTIYGSNGYYYNYYTNPYGGGYGYDNRGNYYNYCSNPYGGSVYDNRGNYYNYYTNPW
jgi:hypothetical protein